jgi:hypothetical protein
MQNYYSPKKGGPTRTERTKETAMDETVDEIVPRFGRAAIEELNGLRRSQREPTKNFVLLIASLFILVLLLYALIIWNTMNGYQASDDQRKAVRSLPAEVNLRNDDFD